MSGPNSALGDNQLHFGPKFGRRRHLLLVRDLLGLLHVIARCMLSGVEHGRTCGDGVRLHTHLHVDFAVRRVIKQLHIIWTNFVDRSDISTNVNRGEVSWSSSQLFLLGMDMV